MCRRSWIIYNAESNNARLTGTAYSRLKYEEKKNRSAKLARNSASPAHFAHFRSSNWNNYLYLGYLAVGTAISAYTTR